MMRTALGRKGGFWEKKEGFKDKVSQPELEKGEDPVSSRLHWGPFNPTWRLDHTGQGVIWRGMPGCSTELSGRGQVWAHSMGASRVCVRDGLLLPCSAGGPS